MKTQTPVMGRKSVLGKNPQFLKVKLPFADYQALARLARAQQLTVAQLTRQLLAREISRALKKPSLS